MKFQDICSQKNFRLLKIYNTTVVKYEPTNLWSILITKEHKDVEHLFNNYE
jgi:hypothetical protein